MSWIQATEDERELLEVLRHIMQRDEWIVITPWGDVHSGSHWAVVMNMIRNLPTEGEMQ